MIGLTDLLHPSPAPQFTYLSHTSLKKKIISSSVD